MDAVPTVEVNWGQGHFQERKTVAIVCVVFCPSAGIGY